jgi:hypothetical protein
MNEMSRVILSNVERHFDQPKQVADAKDLSLEQKVAILTQWEQDLRQLMVASQERMIPSEPTRAPEMLRSVRESLRTLGVSGSS